jgi:membrane protein DedA with SNARE-associated domain/rhodanese-related sulfurtransferase
MATLIQWLEQIGVPAVFALVLAEQAGLPLPTYPILIVAGAWSAQGGPPLWRIAVAVILACILADALWYAAARRYGSRILRVMCRLSLEPDSCVADTERMFARFGTRILLVAKFVPGLGAVTTAMSGVVRTSLLGFVVHDAIGAALWGVSGLLIGSVFHDAVDDVFAKLTALGRAGGALVLLAFIAFIAFKYYRRHQFFRQLRMDRITVQELSRLLEAGALVRLIDARPSDSRERDGMIPGAVAFEALLRDVAQDQRGGEVVVYCACPNEASAARIARKLINMGFHPVRPLAGGIHAWQDAGFGIVRAAG